MTNYIHSRNTVKQKYSDVSQDQAFQLLATHRSGYSTIKKLELLFIFLEIPLFTFFFTLKLKCTITFCVFH